MCGIGAISSKYLSANALLREFTDMCYLSYVARRGEHSSGMAWLDAVGRKIYTTKELGPPGKGCFLSTAAGVQTHSVLGHVRYASCGAVTVRNAHPILNEDGKLALIHNGHIVHHDELRKRLTSAGHKFVTDTDSEVILHIFERELEYVDQSPKSILKAAIHTARTCAGQKNFIILFDDDTIAAYSDGTLSIDDQKERIILASVPTTRSSNWSHLPYGTALVIKKGEILSRETDILVFPIKSEYDGGW